MCLIFTCKNVNYLNLIKLLKTKLLDVYSLYYYRKVSIIFCRCVTVSKDSKHLLHYIFFNLSARSMLN